MSTPNPQSLARILVSPWQQRRGINSRWGPVLVVLLCLAGPIVLGTWSLFCDPSQVAQLRQSAVFSGWAATAAIMVAGWAVFIGNVLQQNHPTIARLVPHHASQLRLALLVGWALVVLAAVALPGFAFDAPLAWACGMAAALALLAAALRWPLLWLGGIIAPFVVGGLTRVFGASALTAALGAAWARHHVVATCFVAVAGAALLLRIVRSGGTAHRAAYERRQRLHATLHQLEGGGAMPASCGKYGWIMGLAVGGRAYAGWMERLLAQPRSPVMARLRVGLGPANHWTRHILQAAWFVLVSVVMCGVLSLALGRGMLAYVLPWLAFSVLTSVCSPALQAVPQLQQTQREQALLVLLPGVPRGPRLNRWLAWQMSVTYVVAAAAALGLAWLLIAVAEAMEPGVALRATGGMPFGVAAALLPQVAWQWRHWARLRGATGGLSQLPTLAPIVLGIGAMALHVGTGVSYVAVGVAMAIAAMAYCAWRWRRMAGEETAFPVGRSG